MITASGWLFAQNPPMPKGSTGNTGNTGMRRDSTRHTMQSDTAKKHWSNPAPTGYTGPTGK